MSYIPWYIFFLYDTTPSSLERSRGGSTGKEQQWEHVHESGGTESSPGHGPMAELEVTMWPHHEHKGYTEAVLLLYHIAIFLFFSYFFWIFTQSSSSTVGGWVDSIEVSPRKLLVCLRCTLHHCRGMIPW